jgi:hypothetical protein
VELRYSVIQQFDSLMEKGGNERIDKLRTN